MPRNASGTYTLPVTNPVVTGTLITAAWANGTMPDIGSELTNSLDRNGRGAMLAVLKLVDGSLAAPGVSFANEVTSGFYRASAGVFHSVILGVSAGSFQATGWNGAVVGNVTGNVTGNLTGNVTGHASLDLALTGGALTGALSIATTAVQNNLIIDCAAAAGPYTTWARNGTPFAYAGTGTLFGTGVNTDFAIRANTGALLFSANGGTEMMRLDTSGNLGIGITSGLGKKLHIGDNTVASVMARFASTTANFDIGATANGMELSSVNAVAIILTNNNVERFRIGSDGLHTASGVFRFFGGSAGLPAVTTAGYVDYNAPILRHFIGDGTGYSMRQSKRTGSVTTDLNFFEDGGNVGFGAAPAAGYKHDVAGTIRSLGGEASASGFGFRVLNSTSNGGGDVTAVAGVNGGIRIGADSGPMGLFAGGLLRQTIPASTAVAITHQQNGNVYNCALDTGATSGNIPIGGIIGALATGAGFAALLTLQTIALSGANTLTLTGFGGNTVLSTGTYRFLGLLSGSFGNWIRTA